uniref:UBA domain-containing protein n=1 Tax=Populus davidiana TaxID=266767 RepID=A0A6M2EUS4_9ROSI
MEYDFRNRTSSPYDTQSPMYRSSTPLTTAPTPSHPMYGPSLYPRVSQPAHPAIPPVSRHHSFPQPSSSSPSSGLGIRVMIKPEYRITPPPQLTPQIGEIPRRSVQFDFELERQIIAEAEKGSVNWSRLLGSDNLPSKPLESTPSTGPTADPVERKYIASGLSRDAVPLAVANYGDNPTKVQEFVNGYTLLREMGFSSNSVAEALLMYDNDTDKALAHFLSSS